MADLIVTNRYRSNAIRQGIKAWPALHRERVENARRLEWSNLTYFFLREIN